MKIVAHIAQYDDKTGVYDGHRRHTTVLTPEFSDAPRGTSLVRIETAEGHATVVDANEMIVALTACASRPRQG